MRIWGGLIVAIWLASVGGLLACAAIENRVPANRLFALLIVAWGQSFMFAPLWAIRHDVPLSSWQRTLFGIRTYGFTRRGYPYRYWIGVTVSLAIGFAATTIGVWLLFAHQS